MKKIKLFLLTITILASYSLTAQVAVTTDGSSADGSAMLEIKSSEKGFLPPRVANVNDVSNPAEGLMVYDLSSHCMRYYNGTKWSECIGIYRPTCVEFVDERDMKSYTAVLIGTQCWMAENLNIGTRIDGGVDQTQNTPEEIIEKYSYDDLEINCGTYGGMYQWNEIMQYVTTEATQGICPTGWHIPTDDEWKVLEMNLGMSQEQANLTGYRGTNEGSKLAGNEPLWTNGNLDSNADFGTSGFAGLPGGKWEPAVGFVLLNSRAYFWSSSEESIYSWYRELYSNNAKVSRYSYYFGEPGFSVRCLQDLQDR